MAVGDVMWCAFSAQTSTNWEVGLYQYTSANALTSVAILDSSNAGAAVNFPAGTTDVYCISPIETTTFSATNPGGRLSFGSVAVPVTSVVNATSVQYIPYSSQTCPVYDGTRWHNVDIGASGLQQTLADTTKSPAATVANTNYDMFVWVDTGGVVRCTRGPAWTSTLARSAGTALAQSGPYLTNNVAITNGPAANRGTYVGTIATNASNFCSWQFGGLATGGTPGIFPCWNMYNRVDVGTMVSDAAASWTYSSSTWRQADGSAGNQVSFIVGWQEDAVFAEYMTLTQGTNLPPSFAAVGIGIDTLAQIAGSTAGATTPVSGTAGLYAQSFAMYAGNPAVGSHILYAMEMSPQAVAVTFYGGTGGGGSPPMGLRFRFRM
jgi:hypothetical protein